MILISTGDEAFATGNCMTFLFVRFRVLVGVACGVFAGCSDNTTHLEPRGSDGGQGGASIGVGSAMKIKVSLVPVTVGGQTVAVSAADSKALEDYARARFPTQSFEFTMHDTAATTWTKFTDAQEQPAFDLCADIKQKDKAAPNLYHALFIPGSKSSVSWDGSSGLPGPSQAEALDRCSIVITNKNNVVGDKALTFTHELGHANGLPHAPCGDPAAPDKKYPYPNAQIGVQGYDILAAELFPAQTPDIMSYCDPAWISDYNWNKVEARVRVLSSWDTQHASMVGRSLRGIFRSTGSISWGLVNGTLDSPQAALSSGDTARAVDGKLAGRALPVVRRPMMGTHGLSEVYVNLPDASDATAYEVVVDGKSSVVQLR